MLDEIYANVEQHMRKTIDALHHDLGKLRTGRASPSLIENVLVPYYGNDTPLNQIANITVADARTLAISPWEKNMVAAIEKAIRSADLGLNPTVVGTLIRIPLPPLTEERRKDLIKVMRTDGEKARVAIRNLRRDANNAMKELQKDKQITEDELKKGNDRIQKITDLFIAEIDKVLNEKEADLMEF